MIIALYCMRCMAPTSNAHPSIIIQLLKELTTPRNIYSHVISTDMMGEEMYSLSYYF